MRPSNTLKFYPLLPEEEPLAKIMVDEVNRQRLSIHRRRYSIEDVLMNFDTDTSKITFNVGNELIIDVHKDDAPKNVTVFKSDTVIPLSLSDAIQKRTTELAAVLTDLNVSLHEITNRNWV